MKKFDIFIYLVIVLNAAVIFIEECGIENNFLSCIDVGCLLIFVYEMFYKIYKLGWKGYTSSTGNIFDAVIVVLSVPSLFSLPNLSVLLTLRLTKLSRLVRFSKTFRILNKDELKGIIHGLRIAIRRTFSIIAVMLFIIFMVGLISCNLYSDVAPEFFGNPLLSIFTTFELFTVEGWTEIPKALSGLTSVPYFFSMIYFGLIVFVFGILGMSFINSIFVDAMCEDNNDDVKNDLNEIKRQLEEISKRLN